jgi:hypothetical protein
VDSATNTVAAGPRLDDIADHNQVLIGAHQQRQCSCLLAKGDLAEVHFIAGVVTTEDYDAMLAGTIKPEELAGWVNGVILKVYAADHISADGWGQAARHRLGTSDFTRWQQRISDIPRPEYRQHNRDAQRGNHGGDDMGLKWADPNEAHKLLSTAGLAPHKSCYCCTAHEHLSYLRRHESIPG